MKIGIIGTRGIPNRYGGFEQFAEYAGPLLAERGHEVYVYNSSSHPYRETQWKMVHIIRKPDPEEKWGTIGQFVYDLNCIRDARKREFDIILQLGYTSSSVWSFLFPKGTSVITNMDGFEWNRKKYSKMVQWFLRFAEKWAVKYSQDIIADSTIMQSYIKEKYQRTPDYISYGAVPFDQPDESVLEKYGLTKNTYNLVIARFEPENNIETIINGHLHAKTENILCIIGNFQNKHGKYLTSKYNSSKIRFMGPLFNMHYLNQLRYHSGIYFHGHSVGGTNPSLLEAMASSAFIVAHDNIFNRAVLGNDAVYFSNSEDVQQILDQHICKQHHQDKIRNNFDKIRDNFSWEKVADLLEDCFKTAHLPKSRA